MALNDRYKRLYMLESNKDCVVADRIMDGSYCWSWNREDIGSRNNDQQFVADCWHWDLADPGGYSVANTSPYVDNVNLSYSEPRTLRMKVLPRKINISIWRVARDRLPTQLNLTNRGIEIELINCISCSYMIKSLKHVLFECDVALEL
ncbi:uncharacterized protein [Rutidosis leptorrhynchoides]|uniref:uncharacterized protein n=1 Tax=Rutidosis leptorrhynchoides TaxID=125765 RepID=UPI003A99150C